MSHRPDRTADRRYDDKHQQALLDLARRGSDESHQALLKIQTRWMLSWFERELPRRLRSKLDAEDLVQDARIHAWQGLVQFEGDLIANYRGWLLQICHNCLLSGVERYVTAFCREVTREVHLNERAIANGKQRPFNRRWSAEGSGQAVLEAAEQVERLLAGLPRRARQVVIFHVCEDRTFGDIAHELGCSLRTASRDWEESREYLRGRRDA